jgi:hypothetical protein
MAWLMLIVALPANQPAGRAWRTLRARGAVALKNSVWVLPHGGDRLIQGDGALGDPGPGRPDREPVGGRARPERFHQARDADYRTLADRYRRSLRRPAGEPRERGLVGLPTSWSVWAESWPGCGRSTSSRRGRGRGRAAPGHRGDAPPAPGASGARHPAAGAEEPPCGRPVPALTSTVWAILDSSGTGLPDVAGAALAFERVVPAGRGTKVRLGD